MAKYEQPQKGNPHRLTIEQHIFPKASIARFGGESGLVELFSKKLGAVKRLAPNNNMFCVKRVWDQRTEAGIGKKIEDSFQALATGILAGSVRKIGFFEKTIVEEFFSLWRTRQKFALEGLKDIRVDGLKDEGLTIDQQELLERKHVIFMRDGVFPGRFSAGIHVVGYINAFRSSNENIQWGIVQSWEGEFIVPDCFEDMMIIPLAPNVAIMADQPNSYLTESEVALINRIAIQRSTNHYFARKLSACPLISRDAPRSHRVFAI